MNERGLGTGDMMLTGGKLKYWVENLSLCHFVFNSFTWADPEMNCAFA
jgi:hypothetical protein